jgi:CRISPR-associated protein Cas1
MNYDGAIISQTLPPIPIKADLRKAQWQASDNPETKFSIAHALVKAKITRSMQVLDYLSQRYDVEREVRVAKGEASKLGQALTIPQLRTVEGRTALRYWEAYRKCLPEPLRFQGRMLKTKAMGAIDPVNLALNYGFGFLKCECRTAVNSVGLEPALGYLHEPADYMTRESLVYDLEEPFRWLIDLAVVRAFEIGKLDANSFYFTEQDYSYHFELDAKGRFLQVLRETFNSSVNYKGRKMRWDTVIREKAVELGRYLKGSTPELSFNEPAPVFGRMDSQAVRRGILNLTQSEAEKLGIGKSTLHYLRQKARSEHTFRTYSKVREKLSTKT